MGLALGSDVALVSKFDRKQYYYADLPKGYQISQFDEPLLCGGSVDVPMADGTLKKVGITRAHLEEDAGKNMHDGDGSLAGSTGSRTDLNRAGVPLLEIVTEPDLRSGEEAAEYGAEIRRIVRALGVSNGNMQEGSLRCDVNVSVRAAGSAVLGTKVEVKNMNSFSAMRAAIDHETKRQVALLESGRGDEIRQETRLWDEGSLTTRAMRAKEGLADYRYFPEPDLPPLVLTPDFIDACRDAMPELPRARRERYAALGLPRDDATFLTEDTDAGLYFDAVLAAGAPAKGAANWVMGDVAGWCKSEGVAWAELGERLSPGALAELVSLIEDDILSGKIGKQLLPSLLDGAGKGGGGEVKALAEREGLIQESDPEAVKAVVREAMAANPKQLEQYRGGKTKLRGFFQGACMKISGGTVNPKLLAQVLPAMLDGEEE